jgi:predicted transcriptional regulator
MPRGGSRPGAGAPGAWLHGKTVTIRVPAALVDRLLVIARRLDRDELTDPRLAIAGDRLREALTLKANAGGAIKAKIREALALLGGVD